jgi:hypothetical protein
MTGPFQVSVRLAVGATVAGACLVTAFADVLTIKPSADTTLIEVAPSNNLGGMAYVNGGTTQNFTRNRGLFRFEITGAIPSGSLVSNVAFIIEVVGKPADGFTPAVFGLHRVLKPWGEGDKLGDPLHPGFGSPASSGEATWTDRFAFSTNSWTQPGGEAGSDYVAAASSEATVYSLDDSPYTFASTSALIADVQRWVDTQAENFGWILVCQTESANFTARRFGSREDAVRPPLLQVEFVPPPKIKNVSVSGQTFTLQFTAQAGQAYTVEWQEAFTSGWATLTNISAQAATTEITVADSIAGMQRYYRLRLP